MASQEFPFNLKNTFIIALEFSRPPELPSKIETEIIVDVKVVFDANTLDRMQVQIRMKSGTDSPISFMVEVVGLFECQTEEARSDKNLQIKYLEERGLFMLWPIAVQLIRTTTSQMGMPPLDVVYPTKLELGNLEVAKK